MGFSNYALWHTLRSLNFFINLFYSFEYAFGNNDFIYIYIYIYILIKVSKM